MESSCKRKSPRLVVTTAYRAEDILCLNLSTWGHFGGVLFLDMAVFELNKIEKVCQLTPRVPGLWSPLGLDNFRCRCKVFFCQSTQGVGQSIPGKRVERGGLTCSSGGCM